MLALDDAALLKAAKVRAKLEKKGKGTGPYDTLIAGHVRSLGARLIAANPREFGRVPGLKLGKWVFQ